MKRNWDVIRDVLIEVEELSDSEIGDFRYVANPHGPADAKVRADHAFLLCRAGFLDGVPVEYTDNTPWELLSPKLTWAGHDLLETIRSKAVWERIKATAKEKGIELTFDAVKAIGKVALDWVIAS